MKEIWQMTKGEYSKINLSPLPSNLEALTKKELLELPDMYDKARVELLKRRICSSDKGFSFIEATTEYSSAVERLGGLCITTPKREIIEITKSFDKAIRREIGLLEGQHRVFVLQALKEGKPVPKKVLKEYPELLKRRKNDRI